MSKTTQDLDALIHMDLQDRDRWERKQDRTIRKRLGVRKRNAIYPGAPNFVEPIIDDNVRSITSAEI